MNLRAFSRILFFLAVMISTQSRSFADDCAPEFLKTAFLESNANHPLVRERMDERSFQVYDPYVILGKKSYKPAFYFRASVDSNGTLVTRVASKLGDGTRSTKIYAGKLFDEMIEHFRVKKTEIKSISGIWMDGTNLDEFNRLTRAGLEPEDAALQTWTGQQAQRHGYSEISLRSLSGEPGDYRSVTVDFKKPQSASSPLPLVRERMDEQSFQVYDPNVNLGKKQRHVNHPKFSPAFYFRSFVDEEGMIISRVASKLDDGTQSTQIYASKLFDEMMAHFKAKHTTVNGIQGLWVSGTNLEEFNRLTKAGLSLEDAARATWTGQQAQKYGFTDVEFRVVTGKPGKYRTVTLDFTKPRKVSLPLSVDKTHYQWVDQVEKFSAEVKANGNLILDVSSKSHEAKIFDDMIEHFNSSGTSIKRIQETIKEGDLLREFNRVTRQGASVETAAQRTWIGQQAERHGYTQVKVITTGRKAGQYESVKMVFSR